MELTKNIRLRATVGSSCNEDCRGKGVQERTERIRRRESTSWKAQREVVRRSAQGW